MDTIATNSNAKRTYQRYTTINVCVCVCVCVSIQTMKNVNLLKPKCLTIFGYTQSKQKVTMSKLNSKWKLRNTAVLRNDFQQSEQFLCAQTGKLKLKKISVTFIF